MNIIDLAEFGLVPDALIRMGIRRLLRKKTGELVRHTNHTRSVTFTPDGSRIISGSYDKSIPVWDRMTGILRSGQMLAIAGYRKVFVYEFPKADAQRATKITALIKRFKDDDYATRIRTSKRLEKLGAAAEPFLPKALESDDAEVRIRRRRLIQRLESSQGGKQFDMLGRPQCVTFSPDGKLLIAGDDQSNLFVWNTNDWSPSRKFGLPKIDEKVGRHSHLGGIFPGKELGKPSKMLRQIQPFTVGQ